MPLWIKLKLWTSTAFLRSKVLASIRNFFTHLTDVRPRSKSDYYPVFRWLVSKRLAFAIVIAVGIVSVIYISTMLPEGAFGKGDSGTPTYRYRSLPLKFHKGTVNILGRGDYLAFTGEVSGGAANGRGTLYAQDGSIVYEGEFSSSKYNGSGSLYYSNGSPKYTGSFTDNVYDGQGTSYRPNGVIEYSGDYVAGERTGTGTLYNSVGSQVFTGSFLKGEIVYQDFLNRPTSEIPSLYSGERVLYLSTDESCVTMPEIDAVYAVKDGSTTLENEWTVERIYVLRSAVPLEGGVCRTVRELAAAMGEPLYYGSAWIDLPEAVAWNLLAPEQSDRMETVRVDATASLDDAYTVSDYDRDFQVYLYTFEQNGLLYTFYFTGAGESEFVMYAIEKA